MHKQQRKIALLNTLLESSASTRETSEGAGIPEATANVFDFGGGCVCCRAGDVEREGAMAADKKKVPLDTIILETTGVADPLVFAECASGANARRHS